MSRVGIKSRIENHTIPLARRRARTHTHRHMNLRLTDGKGRAFHALVAAACVGALLFAFILSAIPHLHEQIHAPSSAANHECAVTLLASGKYQHSPNMAVSVTPPRALASFALSFVELRFASAHLEFSLLEHAPPVGS